jgi:tetratricopeptide (TPR) repeat protein
MRYLVFAILGIAFSALSACVHPLPPVAQRTCLDPTYRGHDAYVAAVEACIKETSVAIEALPPRSPQRAQLLLKRASLYQTLAGHERSRREEVLRAALADYDAAVAIDPTNDRVRFQRAGFLLRQEGREEDVLHEAEILIAQVPESVEYRRLRGVALAALGRHKDAITDYNLAMKLAQRCAEASSIQKMANEFRHHSDPPLPPPGSLEEFRKEHQNDPLYDVPEPATARLGFPCTPSDVNSFETLVLLRYVLFLDRARAYRALGDKYAALQDFKYSVLSSPLRDYSSFELCELEIELGHDWSAVEDCRKAFDFNLFVMSGNPELAAKIGEFLLADGDLKGACRLAFPWFLDEDLSQTFSRDAPSSRTAASTMPSAATKGRISDPADG